MLLIINLTDIFPANLIAMNKLYPFVSRKSLCAGLTALVLCLFAAPICAQTIPTPTQTDEIIIDNGTSGKADPNDRIRYKVTIQNTGGANATGTQLGITPDPRTTFVPNSFRSSPLAVPDGPYDCIGNVGINVPAGSGVKANDFDDALGSATVAVTTNPSNGQVLLNAADGSFTYMPNPGFEGMDQFTYTLTDGNSVGGPGVPTSDMATVSIIVSGMIWFVDNSAGSNGDGRLGTPFNSLPNFVSGAADDPGDNIFLYRSIFVPTDYTGGITLLNNQKLIGQGASSTLASATGLTAPTFSNTLPSTAGTLPIIANSGGNGITLGSGNTIRGVQVGNTTGANIFGNNFGTLTVGNTTSPDVTLSSPGQALNLTNGAFNATSKFAGITSFSSGTTGISLNTVSGTLASTSTTISSPLGTGMDIQSSTASLDFGTTSVTKSTSGTAISITNSATGSVTFGSLSVETNTVGGTGLFASTGGTINIGGTTNTIVATGGAALDVTSTSFGTGATFSTLSSTNSPGKGINIDNVSGALTANGGSITTATGIAVDINAGSGTITYAGSITNSSNRSVEVTGRTGGTVTLSGNISDTGTGINVASNTGGTIAFSGSTKNLNTGANTAVNLSSNAGGTINFTGGGLVITTTSGTGFNATGGGTVTVQGTGNTINSTSGATALNVVSTTIGASGLTFQSITSNGGSATGIILDNTGTGGLTVTGTGSAGSGGTIANKTGANGSNTTGVGIYLNSCSNVSLTRMQLNNFTNFGIRGLSVNNFTMDNCVVNHSSGKNGDDAGTDEGSVYFGAENPGGTNGLTGTANITNCMIEDGYENNFKIANISGTLSQFTMTGTTIRDNSNVSPGNNGFEIRAQGTANITADITTSTFTGNRANGIQVTTTPEHTGTVDVEIGIAGVAGSGGTFTNNNIGINIGHGSAGVLNFDIHRGIFNSNPGLASPININLAAGGGGPMSGSITNNTITNANSPTGPGIRVNTNGTDADASNVLTILVSNNNISQIANRGIEMIARDGNSTINATITNNTVALTDPLSADAIQVNAGAVSTDVTTINAHISGNTATTIAGQFGVRVRQRFVGTTYRLQGYGGSATDDAAVAAFLATNNGGATTSADHGGAGFLNIVMVPLP